MKIELLTGDHLTISDRSAIDAMIKGGISAGRKGRTDFTLRAIDGIYTFTKTYMGRGLGFIGEELRKQTDTFTFKLQHDV